MNSLQSIPSNHLNVVLPYPQVFKMFWSDPVLASRLGQCEKRLGHAARTLEARLSPTVTRERLDQALAHYAFGLTQPLYADREPAEQLDAIVSLMSKALPPGRVDQAIHSKQRHDERFSAACESLVRLGERDALAIIKSQIPPSSAGKQGTKSSDGAGAAEGTRK
ncbi:MAG: hypothetical protein KGI75_14200 [Rhizobiaceae bacterium]|nr:hypothetical protein [Rhizobiaceae bacterium]